MTEGPRSRYTHAFRRAMIRPLLAALVLLQAAPAALPAGDAAATALEKTVRGRLDALDAQSTLYAKHIESGREIAVRADEPVNTVSVIKIPVMVLAYRDAEAGRLSLDERHVIAAEEVRRGTGILQSFAVGLNPTWRDLVTQMIITSDNTATDILIARLGRERVNQMLDALGYKETRLRMTIGELFRGVWEQTDPKNASLSDREVFERGFPDDAAAPSRYLAYVADPMKWFGRTTAREISRMLEQLQKGELAGPASTEEMIRILKRQLYFSRLPQRIRFRASVGHKTGDWPPIIGNDVGILYSDAGPIVVSVFTNQNRGSFFDLEAAIGKVAEDILDAWGAKPAPRRVGE
jgi:beta-lactamase class A